MNYAYGGAKRKRASGREGLPSPQSIVAITAHVLPRHTGPLDLASDLHPRDAKGADLRLRAFPIGGESSELSVSEGEPLFAYYHEHPGMRTSQAQDATKLWVFSQVNGMSCAGRIYFAGAAYSRNKDRSGNQTVTLVAKGAYPMVFPNIKASTVKVHDELAWRLPRYEDTVRDQNVYPEVYVIDEGSRGDGGQILRRQKRIVASAISSIKSGKIPVMEFLLTMGKKQCQSSYLAHIVEMAKRGGGEIDGKALVSQLNASCHAVFMAHCQGMENKDAALCLAIYERVAMLLSMKCDPKEIEKVTEEVRDTISKWEYKFVLEVRNFRRRNYIGYALGTMDLRGAPLLVHIGEK